MNRISDMELLYDKIYRYCYYKVHNRERAEDITQETFLRFFQKRQYQSTETPLKLLYTIAGNLCIDEGRKKQVLSIENSEVGASQIYQGMEDTVLTNYMLKKAMEKLDEKERDIIFLYLVNEESFQVIAKTLQLSRYAVYRRYAHAINVLRKELE